MFYILALPEEDEQTIIALKIYFDFNELELLQNTIIMITIIYNIRTFSIKLHRDLFKVIKYTSKNKVYSSLSHAVSKKISMINRSFPIHK